MRKVAELLAGKAVVVQINTEQSPRIAARFTVRGIPVLLLLLEGRVVHRLQGAQSAEAILRWFAGAIK